jgi:hypothetical protein
LEDEDVAGMSTDLFLSLEEEEEEQNVNLKAELHSISNSVLIKKAPPKK